MRTLDLHRDAGAYALGVLDATDPFRFEEHLMDCPRCALLLAEFGGVRAQLDEYARRTPAEVAPFAATSPDQAKRGKRVRALSRSTPAAAPLVSRLR